jgi:hypothetical protein
VSERGCEEESERVSDRRTRELTFLGSGAFLVVVSTVGCVTVSKGVDERGTAKYERVKKGGREGGMERVSE